GLTAFLEKVLDAQHFVATGNPGDTAAHDFQDRGSPNGLDETVQLVSGTCQLNGVNAWRYIDDLSAEDVGGALDLGTLRARGLDLDKHQFALDVCAFRKVDQLNHFDQLVEVFGDLLDHLLMTDRGQGQARQRWIFGRCHSQAFDVVVALREQTDHPGQGARLVFHQQGNDMSHDQVRSVLLS